jgi:glycosyltransferase involved in cell wall biosynthesis
MKGGQLTRVCLITGEYPPDQGGVADYTRCLAVALAGRHALVDVVTSRRPAGRAGSLFSAGEVPEALRGWITVHRAMRRWGWDAVTGLRRAVSLLHPDVVHLQYQAAAYGMSAGIHLAPWRLRQADRVVAVTYHDLRVPYLFPKAGRVRRWALLALGRHADRVVATNAEDYATLCAQVGDRLDLIPIGSNVPDAPPAEYERERFRLAAGVGPRTGMVAYFGTLNESKGALEVLDALEQLLAAGRDVCLVMIGSGVGTSDPTNRASLEAFEQRASARGLESAIRWTGHLPAAGVSAWLHAADVAALPYRDGASYRRGSLLAAVEHGLPVVTTRPRAAADSGAKSGAPPPLEDRRNVALVPAGDAGALAAAICEVLDVPDYAERLARGAKELSRAFGWDAIAARHLELYASARAETGA